MATKRFTERSARPFAGARVNRAAGTIENVLICGITSANGRDYPPAMFRRDYGKYEGRPVNCDHSREGTVDRRFGWFSDVRPGDDGRPRGTLNALKSHPMFERVFEAAERNPSLFGFSHVVNADTTNDQGRERIERIISVESVDLVADPATTRGLFEGLGGPDAPRMSRDRVAADWFAAAESIIDQALAGAITPAAALDKLKTIFDSAAAATENRIRTAFGLKPIREARQPARSELKAFLDSIAL